MYLDIRTIIILTALSGLMLNLGLLATARACSGRLKGAGRWAAACGGEALGWGLLGLRGVAPDVVSIVAGNTLVLLAAAMYYHALKEFYDEPPDRFAPYTLVAAAAAALSYFTFVSPDVTARVAVVALAGAPLTLLCARALLRGPGRRSPVGHAMGYGFLACGPALLARLCYTLLAGAGSGAGPRSFSPDAAQGAFYLGSYAVLVLLSLGFLLLCNERLTLEALGLAARDSLTGAYNRRAVEELMRKEASRRRRLDLPMAVLLVDLDHFKRINDTHGHAAGDAILKGFVATATGQLRAQDTLGRYGGEEFLIVMPDTTRESALAAAERLRESVAAVSLEVGTGGVSVTASIGVAALDGDDRDVDTLLRRADAALYDAKARGRNRAALAQHRLAS